MKKNYRFSFTLSVKYAKIVAEALFLCCDDFLGEIAQPKSAKIAIIINF
jgi:hypothetical protein